MFTPFCATGIASLISLHTNHWSVCRIRWVGTHQATTDGQPRLVPVLHILAVDCSGFVVFWMVVLAEVAQTPKISSIKIVGLGRWTAQ